MKKLYAAAFMIFISLTAQAQLSGTGYYRFRNADKTNEYISLANDKFSYQFLFGTITGGGLSNMLDNSDVIKPLLFSAAEMYMKADIHMVEDDNCIDPSTILYLSKYSGSKYNIIGQGTSLLTLTSGNYVASVRLYFNDLYTTVSPSGDYFTSSINIAASGVENISYNALKFALGKSMFLSQAKLGNYYFMDESSIFAINSSNTALNAKWIVEPVDHLNVNPTIEYGGKFYTTLYTAFAYKLSGQVEKAYAISSIGSDGLLENPVVAANGGTVPAGTPVILECATDDVSQCQIIPMGTPLFSAPDETAQSAPTTSTATNYTETNLLKSTYFCNQDAPYSYGKYSSNGTVYSTMNLQNYTNTTNKYVLGTTASGKLGFVKPDETVTAMPANKAWLEYTGNAEELVLPFEASKPGDVNHDGDVTIADVTALVNIILGKATEENNPDDYDFKAAKVNDDDEITIADVTALVNIILGKTQ